MLKLNILKTALNNDFTGNLIGEIEPKMAWQVLQEQQSTYLVDVRTNKEWQFIGYPDLSNLSLKIIKLSFRLSPNMQINGDFASELSRIIPEQNAVILFICRSGGRSFEAATSMAKAGYNNCYNIKYGFEGEADEDGLYGKKNGWQYDNLPWTNG